MPVKNAIKHYEPDSYYHVYNRGVDSRIIFTDDKDRAVFLSYLKVALLPPEDSDEFADREQISVAVRFNLRRNNFADELELLAFCLMPNHFHLLFYQSNQDAITRLMRSVITGYSSYFNKRHIRRGPLFESRYKAVAMKSEAQWLHISRYIHLNPIDLGVDYRTYVASSYLFYFDESRETQNSWVKPDRILGAFSDPESYKKFHRSYETRHAELKKISKELGL